MSDPPRPEPSASVRQPPLREIPLGAQIYLAAVTTVTAAAAIPLVLRVHPGTEEWKLLGVLSVAIVLSEIALTQRRGNVALSPSSAVLVAAALLLPLELVVLVGAADAIPQLVRRDRAWYKRLFNVSSMILSALAAGGAASLAFHADVDGGIGLILAGTLAAAATVVTSHVLLLPVLRLAHGVPIREMPGHSLDQLATRLGIAALGITFAGLWSAEPWLGLTIVPPLILTMRSLQIRELRHEATLDAKTTLLNARSFAAVLEEDVERAVRLGRPLSIVMADLDHLRLINNTHGHLAGDAVIQGVARAIESQVRRNDVAARFGGEEFCILLPDMPAEHAVEIAERIRTAVAATEFVADTCEEPIRVTVSLGVAGFPRDGMTPTELIDKADEALYRAKERGRNQVAGVLPPARRSVEPGIVETSAYGFG